MGIRLPKDPILHRISRNQRRREQMCIQVLRKPSAVPRSIPLTSGTNGPTPSARALRVTFPSIRDGADPTYEVHAESTWKRHEDVFTDLTATIDLGAPPEP